MRGGIERYLAARVYGFHLPLYREGRNHGSVVIRVFSGRADRYGTQGPVAAIELHVKDIKDAIRNGVVWYDKRTGRMHVTLWKGGPDELRRLAYRLLAVADALETAWALGIPPRRLEETWLAVRRGAAKRPTRGAAADDGDPLGLDTGTDAAVGGVDEADLID